MMHRPAAAPLAHALRIAALGCLIVGLAACDTPQPCQPDGSCPPNSTCVAGLCRNTLGVKVEFDATGPTTDAGCPEGLGPAARAAPAAARFGGGVALLGGHDHIGRCDIEPVDATSDAHIFQRCGGFAVMADVPGTRYGAMAATAADGALWVVGGRRDVASGVSVPLGDAWRLPPTAATWQSGATADVAGRSHGALVATTQPPALWLYGGDIGISPNAPIASGDLRRLPTAPDAPGAPYKAGAWSLPATQGKGPGPRRGHVMVAVDAELIVLGGRDGVGNAREDIYALDITTLMWRTVDQLADGPTPRFGANAVALANGKILLFGGEDEVWGERNDLWSFDVKPGRWTRIRAGDLGADGRIDGAIAAMPDACAPPADVLKHSASDPERRAFAALVADSDGQTVWLFGGQGVCGALGDLWRLDLSTYSWARTRGAGPGGACPLKRTNCALLCGP